MSARSMGRRLRPTPFAMTQKLKGQFEESDSNYELALRTLARKIVEPWRNSKDNPRPGHADSRNSLWLEYALQAGMWLAV